MTLDSNSKLNFDSPSRCYFLIIGGKYLSLIQKVMEKVNSVTNDIGLRPLAVFLMSKNYKLNVKIDVDYGFSRDKATPVLVEYKTDLYEK